MATLNYTGSSVSKLLDKINALDSAAAINAAVSKVNALDSAAAINAAVSKVNGMPDSSSILTTTSTSNWRFFTKNGTTASWNNNTDINTVNFGAVTLSNAKINKWNTTAISTLASSESLESYIGKIAAWHSWINGKLGKDQIFGGTNITVTQSNGNLIINFTGSTGSGTISPTGVISATETNAVSGSAVYSVIHGDGSQITYNRGSVATVFSAASIPTTGEDLKSLVKRLASWYPVISNTSNSVVSAIQSIANINQSITNLSGSITTINSSITSINSSINSINSAIDDKQDIIIFGSGSPINNVGLTKQPEQKDIYFDTTNTVLYICTNINTNNATWASIWNQENNSVSFTILREYVIVTIFL